MVNTRILEEQLGLGPQAEDQATASRAETAAAERARQAAPRVMRHAPLLQGRVTPNFRTAPEATLGFPPRSAAQRSAAAVLWQSLKPLGERLEALVAARSLLPSIDRESTAGKAFDELRTAQLRAMGARNWRRLGIIAPTRGSGASFVTLGLAASIARLAHVHTLVVDFDLARPTLHRYLGLSGFPPLSVGLHEGQVPISTVGRVGSALALLPNGSPTAAAVDVAQSPEAAVALNTLFERLSPDLILFDLPPLLDDPAGVAALAFVDCVLLVADGTRSTARSLSACEKKLEGQVPLLGLILNKAEDKPLAEDVT